MNQELAEVYLKLAYNWLEFAKSDIRAGYNQGCRESLDRCEIRIKWAEEELQKC